jgi:Excreted virulence factor EspC, type VII ESX diderm
MSAGEILRVNPDVLRTVGTAFGQAGDGLAGVHPDAPLGDAASAVPQLQTAAACGKAQADVATEMAALADGARKYGEKLNSAAHLYQTRDEASAAAIRKIKFPETSADGSVAASG